MRFVLTLSLFALLSLNSFAAPWDIVPIDETARPSHLTSLPPVQMQRGKAANTLQTINGLELDISATGLGDISAIALGENGTLYTADRKTGRIWKLSDRRQDGTIDIRRPLPFTFSAPTGLAIMDSTLYVADQNAVWVIAPGQEPKTLANLTRANSSGGPHSLLAGHDKNSLILGLTTQAKKFRLLKLNKNTGQASLISEGNAGEFHNLAQRLGSEIWMSLGSSLTSLSSTGLNLATDQSITSIALPGQYETPHNWPAQLNDHIIAAHLGPGAMQLIAIPTEFGQISGEPRILVEGFLMRSGRSAWGYPGPLIMDKRGLFFADPHNGALWRLSPKPKPEPKITIVDTASLPPAPSTEPKLTPETKTIGINSSIQGTQIDAKSKIVQPSSIEYGSKLIKDYDAKKAQEDAKEAAEQPKKKRRMSRKRAQKE